VTIYADNWETGQREPVPLANLTDHDLERLAEQGDAPARREMARRLKDTP